MDDDCALGLAWSNYLRPDPPIGGYRAPRVRFKVPAKHTCAQLHVSSNEAACPRFKQIRMLAATAGAAATDESCTNSGEDVLPGTIMDCGDMKHHYQSCFSLDGLFRHGTSCSLL